MFMCRWSQVGVFGKAADPLQAGFMAFLARVLGSLVRDFQRGLQLKIYLAGERYVPHDHPVSAVGGLAKLCKAAFDRQLTL